MNTIEPKKLRVDAEPCETASTKMNSWCQNLLLNPVIDKKRAELREKLLSLTAELKAVNEELQSLNRAGFVFTTLNSAQEELSIESLNAYLQSVQAKELIDVLDSVLNSEFDDTTVETVIKEVSFRLSSNLSYIGFDKSRINYFRDSKLNGSGYGSSIFRKRRFLSVSIRKNQYDYISIEISPEHNLQQELAVLLMKPADFTEYVEHSEQFNEWRNIKKGMAKSDF